MDLGMPIKDGISAALEILGKFAKARILMLTTYDGDDDIYRALHAGAQGYVLKNSTGDKLVPALRAVAAGQQWISNEVATPPSPRKQFEKITPPEGQGLNTHAKGLAD